MPLASATGRNAAFLVERWVGDIASFLGT
jgi:hypothetical protein